MKTISTLPNLRKKFSLVLFTLLLVFFLPIATSQLLLAFGSGQNGNPFSNGTFFPNEGTFQATIRGVNLSGVATFSTGASSSNSTSSNGTSSGTFAVSYQGTTYSGGMDASYDAAGGTIAATMEASVSRSGTGNLTESSTQTLASSFQPTGK